MRVKEAHDEIPAFQPRASLPGAAGCVRGGCGEAPFCFFIPVVVEKLDLRALEAVSEEAGRAALFAGLDGHPGGA